MTSSVDTAADPDRSDRVQAVLARLPLRADLRGRTAYGAPQLQVPVLLNTNENSHPVPPVVQTALVAAVQQVGAGLNRYPDREFSQLRAALADYLGHGLHPDQLWAANGSNEVLQHILQAFGGPGRRALGFVPTYSMHANISATTVTAWVDGQRAGTALGRTGPGAFDLTAELAAEQVRRVQPDVTFLCSPNNPTGTSLELDVVQAVYDATAGVVVVDEAYAEFARPGTPSAISLLPGRERLIVTRTMSKAFALAGARVGYLVADPALTQALRLVRLPYHLSALTQAVACAALAHAPVLLTTVADLMQQRDRIVAALPGLGLVPVPSDANFVLFGGLSDAARTWQELLDAGVLVRDVGLPGHLRVSAGTREEIDAFLAALTALAALPHTVAPR